VAWSHRWRWTSIVGINLKKITGEAVRSVPYISITGNLYVCLQFRAFLEHQIGLSMPNIVPYKNSYQFSVSDHRAVRAIKLLYENCNMALDRKLKFAKTILDSFEVQGNSTTMRCWTQTPVKINRVYQFFSSTYLDLMLNKPF
jgi:hypothetical protein